VGGENSESRIFRMACRAGGGAHTINVPHSVFAFCPRGSFSQFFATRGTGEKKKKKSWTKGQGRGAPSGGRGGNGGMRKFSPSPGERFFDF